MAQRIHGLPKEPIDAKGQETHEVKYPREYRVPARRKKRRAMMLKTKNDRVQKKKQRVSGWGLHCWDEERRN